MATIWRMFVTGTNYFGYVVVDIYVFLLYARYLSKINKNAPVTMIELFGHHVRNPVRNLSVTSYRCDKLGNVTSVTHFLTNIWLRM